MQVLAYDIPQLTATADSKPAVTSAREDENIVIKETIEWHQYYKTAASFLDARLH